LICLQCCATFVKQFCAGAASGTSLCNDRLPSYAYRFQPMRDSSNRIVMVPLSANASQIASLLLVGVSMEESHNLMQVPILSRGTSSCSIRLAFSRETPVVPSRAMEESHLRLTGHPKAAVRSRKLHGDGESWSDVSLAIDSGRFPA